MGSKRECKGTTKAGKACKANPLRAGTEIEGAEASGDYCRQHDPALPESARFGGAVEGAGRKPNPKPTEVLRDRVEGDIDRWLAPYLEGLTATRAVVVGNGPGAYVEVVPDYPTRIAAAEKVLDRVYGRAKQTTELTGEGGGPVETRELIPTHADYHSQVAEVLAEAEAITSS